MADVIVFSIPLRTRFRGVTVREGVLIPGSASWAEFSPFLDYTLTESARWLRCAQEAAAGLWPAPVRDTIPVNCIIPAVEPHTAQRLVRESGCHTAKVKVAEPGQTAADDISRVEAVREALGPHGKLRIDANGAWSVDEAKRMLTALRHCDLEYVEQPCASIEELAGLRRRASIPIAADESVRRVDDPLRVVRAEAADILVLKVQPLGGVHAALRIAADCGLPVVVSSAIETSVGLAAGLALAAALPELPYACGLGTMSLLGGDVVKNSLTPVAGQIRVQQPEIDLMALVKFQATPERESWWRARLRAAETITSSL